ncbi:hypothetical protein PUN28_014333 [Cardiocondyla obscurior]|uniref:Uncharacterized protein n=1 Tax=Cardiocondyla obscurior TaxID=286306 RepID=A0AAW2EZJ3_9HYME
MRKRERERERERKKERKPDGKGNGGCPPDRRRVGQENGAERERKIKKKRKRTEWRRRCREDGGERGRVSWNAAVVPVYTRAGPSLCQGICVFMWNTGEPRRERDREKKRRKRHEGEREKERKRERKNREQERIFSCEREERRRREEPMASQGVLPFRYEGASR